MKNVVVIFTQPIENNTSSMIRGRNIVNEIARMQNRVVCYSPYPDVNSMYYDSNAKINSQIEIRRYGKTAKSGAVVSNEPKTLKQKLIGIVYKFYKGIDLFGSSIFCVKYKKQIAEEIGESNFDTMLSFSDPKTAHIIAGYCKKRNKKIHYIQQWGDPLTEDITNRSALPRRTKWHIEKKLLQRADEVYYVSPITLECQIKLFPRYSLKMKFLPTPCEEQNYSAAHRERITIGYLGSYNLVARDIRPLYEAACSCQEFDFVFVGDSDVKLENKDNIQIINRVAQGDLIKYMEQIDVLVCLMNSKGTQIPGKLYNYAGTNKEILVIQDGDKGSEIRAFFEQYNRYTFVENKLPAIQEVLKNYATKGIPARSCVDDFRVENIVTKLLSY